MTLAGVMLTIFAVGASSGLSIVGYVFLLMAVVSYALYSVFVEKATAYTETEITLIMLPFKENSFAIAVLYQGIGCSILAFFLLEPLQF